MWAALITAVLIIGSQAAWAEISIQNDQKYIGGDGTLHVAGEVSNDSDSPVGQINIRATVYGQQPGVYDSQVMLNNLMPGMRAPFDIAVTGIDADDVEDYDLSLEYRPGAHRMQAIEITSSELYRDSLGGVVVSGKIRNNAETTANAVALATTLYDAHGNVAAALRVQIADYIRSSGESNFAVRLNADDAISGYGLIAESEEYAAVPEFPLGTGALLALSVFAYVVMGRFWGRIISGHAAAAPRAAALTAGVCSSRRA